MMDILSNPRRKSWRKVGIKTGMMLRGVCIAVSYAGGVYIAVHCRLSYEAKKCVHRSALPAEHLFSGW